MAHHLLVKKIKDSNISNAKVYSCGIFAQTGDAPTYNAIEAMTEYGVDLKIHKATNIQEAPIKEMDLILCATVSHRNAVLQQYPELKEKVYTMKEYVDWDPQKKDIDIPDPWGYDITTYRFCASTIDQCLDKLIDKM